MDTNSLAPSFDFTTLLQGLSPSQTNSTPVPTPVTDQSTVSPLAVSAPPAQPSSSDFSRSIYNNAPEMAEAAQGQAQDPQHTGMFGVKGTLRNVLGLLGDAMLVQHGNQPVYKPRLQQEQIADAMTGFQSNPNAAAGRLAAVPGGAQDAENMYNSSQQQQLRLAQQESNNQYRQSREETMQDTRDARLRQGIGGILSAAATPDPKTGQVNPQQWNQARAQALRMGAKVSDFDESEVPETADQYNAGYGQTARQYQQGQTSQQSIDERAAAAAARNQTTIRGQNMRPQPKSTDASMAAPILQKMVSNPSYQPTPQELDVLNRTGHSATRGQPHQGNAVLPPGLRVGGGGNTAPTNNQFKNGVTYTDAHGNRATYNNGQWIPK